MKKNVSYIMKNKSTEKGDTILEFAAALPLLLILFFTLGAACWIFWSQAVADVVAARASREASFNRGGELVLPSAGYEYFGTSVSYLTGSGTAGAIGSPNVSLIQDFRIVVMEVLGGQDFNFGPINTSYTFNGGAASRYWIFYAGPPDPWE